jgi:hypothetical protein
MIEHLIIYLLITVGCSCLWSLSEIFIPVRNYVAKHFPNPFKKMLLCMECSSFWIGVLSGLIFPFLLNYNIILQSIFGGIITYLFVKTLNKFNLV